MARTQQVDTWKRVAEEWRQRAEKAEQELADLRRAVAGLDGGRYRLVRICDTEACLRTAEGGVIRGDDSVYLCAGCLDRRRSDDDG